MKISAVLLVAAGLALGASAAQAQDSTGRPTHPAAMSSSQSMSPDNHQTNDKMNRKAAEQTDGKMDHQMNGEMGHDMSDRSNGHMSQMQGRMNANNGGNHRSWNGHGANRHMGNHGNSAHIRRCEARYHTYNARTDMFYARPGVKKHCKL